MAFPLAIGKMALGALKGGKAAAKNTGGKAAKKNKKSIKKNEKQADRISKRLADLEKLQKEKTEEKSQTRSIVKHEEKDAEIPDRQKDDIALEVKKLVNPLSISNITFSQVFVGNDKKSMSYAKKVTEDNTNYLKKLVGHTEEIAENTKYVVDQDTAIKKDEKKNKYEDPEVFKQLQKSSKDKKELGWLGKLMGLVGFIALFHKQILEWWNDTAWPWIKDEVWTYLVKKKDEFVKWIKCKWEKFKEWVAEKWEKFKGWIECKWEKFKVDAKEFFTETLPDNIKKWWKDSKEWITEKFLKIWEDAPELFAAIGIGIADWVRRKFDIDLKQIFTTIGKWGKGALDTMKIGYEYLMKSVPILESGIDILKTQWKRVKNLFGFGDDEAEAKKAKKAKNKEAKTKAEKSKESKPKSAKEAKAQTKKEIKANDAKAKRNLKKAEAKKEKANKKAIREALKKAKKGAKLIPKPIQWVLDKMPIKKMASLFIRVFKVAAVRLGIVLLAGPAGIAVISVMAAADIYTLGKWIAAKVIGEDAVIAWEAEVISEAKKLGIKFAEATGLKPTKEDYKEHRKTFGEKRAKKTKEARKLHDKKLDKEKIEKQFEKVKSLQDEVRKSPSDTKKKRLYEARKILWKMDEEYTKDYNESYAEEELNRFWGGKANYRIYLSQIQKAKEDDKRRKERSDKEVEQKLRQPGGSSYYTSGDSSEASEKANSERVDISGIKGGVNGVGGATLTGHAKKAAQIISAHEGKYGTVGDIGDGAGISFGAYQLTRASLQAFVKRMDEVGVPGAFHCRPTPRGSACLTWLKAVSTTDESKKIQDEIFVNMYYEPAMKIAKKFGITDPKAQLHVIDHAVNAGNGGAKRMLSRTQKGADSATVASARIKDYESLKNWGRYKKSWTRRVRIIEGTDVSVDSTGQISIDGDTGNGQNTSQGGVVRSSLNSTTGRSSGGYEGPNDVDSNDSQPGPMGKPAFGLPEGGKGGEKFGSFTKPSRPVNRVFVHCTASDSPAHDNINTIRHWHTDPKPQGRGWSDIGYHYMIHKDGRISVGRPIEKTPASAKGNNEGTIAIVLHGLKKSKFTEAQFTTLKKWAMQVNKAYGGKITFHGHCEVSAKTCPVFDYKKVLQLDKDGILCLDGAIAADGKEKQKNGKNSTSYVPLYGHGSQTMGDVQSKLTTSPLDSMMSPSEMATQVSTKAVTTAVKKELAQKSSVQKPKKAITTSGMGQVYIPTMLMASSTPPTST